MLKGHTPTFRREEPGVSATHTTVNIQYTIHVHTYISNMYIHTTSATHTNIYVTYYSEIGAHDIIIVKPSATYTDHNTH